MDVLPMGGHALSGRRCIWRSQQLGSAGPTPSGEAALLQMQVGPARNRPAAWPVLPGTLSLPCAGAAQTDGTPGTGHHVNFDFIRPWATFFVNNQLF